MGRESRRKREQRNRPTPTPGNPHAALEVAGLGEAVQFFTGPDAVECIPTTWHRETLNSMVTRGRVDVPCGSCTECCHHADVAIHEALGENAADYQSHVQPDGKRILNQQPDGSCVYLINDACSIYDRRPIVCRTFDCRVYMLLAVAPSQPFKAILLKANEKFKLPDPMSAEDMEFLEAARFTYGYAVAVKKMDGEQAAGYAMANWQEGLPAVHMKQKMMAHLDTLSPEERQKAIADIQRAARRGRR